MWCQKGVVVVVRVVVVLGIGPTLASEYPGPISLLGFEDWFFLFLFLFFFFFFLALVGVWFGFG